MISTYFSLRVNLLYLLYIIKVVEFRWATLRFASPSVIRRGYDCFRQCDRLRGNYYLIIKDKHEFSKILWPPLPDMYILYQWDNKQEREILTELSLLKYTDSQRYVQFLFSTIKSKEIKSAYQRHPNNSRSQLHCLQYYPFGRVFIRILN